MATWNYVGGAIIVFVPLILALIVEFVTKRQIEKEEREICQPRIRKETE